VLIELQLASTFATYSIFSIVVILNAILLYRFFKTRPSAVSAAP
jgi:hypothetical protein